MESTVCDPHDKPGSEKVDSPPGCRFGGSADGLEYPLHAGRCALDCVGIAGDFHGTSLLATARCRRAQPFRVCVSHNARHACSALHSGVPVSMKSR